ncbi:hypothetical protein TCON_2431 [Astathelohania contejeani]|uniref:Ribosomal protein L22 n=1 Tax=Astathelohania contejeani TaxID=164912 RepID=A0ABQ7HW04_9MICR|nr:hypothetical protein TCON_2431 [Thelohania contejeani]
MNFKRHGRCQKSKSMKNYIFIISNCRGIHGYQPIQNHVYSFQYFQTVQWCYWEASLKPMLPSNRKQSIENKIFSLYILIMLIKKANDISKLSGLKIKAAKQIIRRLNFTLENPHDVIEAMISLKNSAHKYEKMLYLHIKLKERILENRCFIRIGINSTGSCLVWSNQSTIWILVR